jgi:hypothetical protein
MTKTAPAAGVATTPTAAPMSSVDNKLTVILPPELWRILAQLRQLQASRCETRPPQADC